MLANPNQTLPQSKPDYVKPGSQVTVTIGRNIAGTVTPLARPAWDEFRNDLDNVLVDALGAKQVFGPFSGTGEWEGVTEESSVLILISTYPASVAVVEERLSKLAADYSQDAIAWSFGPNLLATR